MAKTVRARKQAKPSPESKAASALIKKLIDDIPRALRPTREALGGELGRGQSAISQYLNGDIPLNLRVVLFFAKKLGKSPTELYPTCPGLENVPPEMLRADVVPQRTFTTEQRAFLEDVINLPDDMQDSLKQVVAAATRMKKKRARKAEHNTT